MAFQRPLTFIDEIDPLGPPADSLTATPLDAANLHTVEDTLSGYTYSVAGAYRNLYQSSFRFDAPTAGTYLLHPVAVGSIGATHAQAAMAVSYLNPASYAAGTLTTNYRVQSTLLANATASTVNWTLGLYTVTASAGAAATNSVTLGTVMSGSSLAFTTPTAGTLTQGTSTDFAAPAGFYAPCVVIPGAAAANSSVTINSRIQVHNT